MSIIITQSPDQTSARKTALTWAKITVSTKTKTEVYAVRKKMIYALEILNLRCALKTFLMRRSGTSIWRAQTNQDAAIKISILGIWKL